MKRQRGFIINPYARTVTGDSNFASVKSLIHFDGADASTTFTDVIGKVWTPSGNAQLDTAQSKFGGSSGLFDGNNDWIQTASHADFDFSGDFTLEFWIRPNSLAATATVFNADGANAAHVAHQLKVTSAGAVDTYLALNSNPLTFTQITSSNGVITTGAWFHVAWTKSGTSGKIFVDGTQVGSGTYASAIKPPVLSRPVRIGAYYTDSEDYNGWLDDFRFTKGVARYTAGFSPPTAAFPDFP